MTKQRRFVLAALLPAVLAGAIPAGAAWERMPLRFEPNVGQAPSDVRFLARGNGYSLALTGNSALFFTGSEPVKLMLHGANASASAVGESPLAGTSNYFAGTNPKLWRTNIANYERVRFRSVYPGVDLVYYGNPAKLEYDFIVNPGGDPAKISFSVEGAKTRIDADGQLVLITPRGEVRQHRPVIYQEIGGQRRDVRGGYRLLANGRVGFAAEGYDQRHALVIDPVLQFATFFGGRIRESAQNVAVDPLGNIYVAGLATSPDYPVSNGAYQNRVIGGTDIYVAKFNSTGTTLIYSTLIGGSADESGAYITVDQNGNAYVSGTTKSSNFPTTPGAMRESGSGNPLGDSEGFVFKLNVTGTNLVYSTLVGGRSTDNLNGIALDTGLNVYVTGDTTSTDFPVTSDVVQTEHKGANDAFVTKINPSGSAVVWSTLLGGDSDSFVVGYESGRAIVVDRAQQVYVSGITTLRDFPTTPAAPYREHLGQSDVFVTKLSANGQQILFSTFLGGEGLDTVNALTLDQNGTNLWIAGTTTSARYPVTPNAFQTFTNGGTPQPNEGFVTRMNASGQILYSTFFGGRGDDQINGIAADVDGNAYIIGTTTSSDLPTTFDAIQKNISGGSTGEPYDAFIAYIDPQGQKVPFATYLGGPRNDNGNGIARDAQGNLFVVGYTQSSGFPLTAGAFQRTTGFGTNTSFIARIGDNRQPAAQLVIVSGNNQSADQGKPLASPLVVELHDPFNNPVAQATVTFTATNAILSANAVNTLGDGRAQVLATMGDRPGPVTVTAKFGGLPAVQFNLTSRRVGPPLPEFSATSVVSFGESNPALNRLAPLGLGVITGQALAQPGNDREVTPADLVNGTLPTNFLGTCVTVDGVAARLLYVSPFRIHFQVPELTRSGNLPVVVITNCGVLGEMRSEPQTVAVQPTSPEFLYWTRNPDGRNPVRAINATTGVEINPQQPARPNDVVRVYLTGAGPTAPSIGSGEYPDSAYATVETPVVTFDGKALPADAVVSSTLTPGYPGFYQLDVRIPGDARNGNLPLTVRYGAQSSPAGAFLRITGGQNLDPRLTTTPASLEFGNVIINTSRELPLTITNSGTFGLNVNAFDAGLPIFTITPSTGFALEPGESRTLTVRFAPTALGSVSAALSIASTDPVNPLVIVPMTGSSIVQPPTPNPVPAISSLQPESVLAGGAPFSLIVNGTGFTQTSVVEVNGQARPTFFNYDKQLIGTVRAQDIASGGDLRITVFTPAPGGGRSGALTFTVRPLPASNQPLALVNQLDLRFCPQVTSYVSVLDGNGSPVRGLTSSSVTCKEDDRSAPCTVAQAAGDTPLSVTIIYGVNGITSEEDLFFIRSGVRSFITSLQPTDRVSILHLEDSARLQLDFTEDKEKALAVIETLHPAGPGNAIYDAVNYTAVQAARQTGRRQAIVLFTAQDNLSGTFGLDQSLGIARSQGVPFYTVAVGPGTNDVALTGYLRQLARDTQGQFFTENRTLSYGALFSKLNTLIQSTYGITHVSPYFDNRNHTLSYTFTIGEGSVTATRVYTPCAP